MPPIDEYSMPKKIQYIFTIDLSANLLFNIQPLINQNLDISQTYINFSQLLSMFIKNKLLPWKWEENGKSTRSLIKEKKAKNHFPFYKILREFRLYTEIFYVFFSRNLSYFSYVGLSATHLCNICNFVHSLSPITFWDFKIFFAVSLSYTFHN